MSRRTDQRRAAVFALYQHDVTGRELDDLFERDASTFTRALAYAAQDYAEDLDGRIERHAKGWTVDRIAPLEKAIMRVALLEMLHPDAAPGDTPIPPEGAIDEAVETAKGFCGAEAPGLRQRDPGRCPARDAREWGVPMTTSTPPPSTRSSRAWSARPSSCAPATSRRTPPPGWSRTAAALASQASAELERLARAAQQEPIPGQDSLL